MQGISQSYNQIQKKIKQISEKYNQISVTTAFCKSNHKQIKQLGKSLTDLLLSVKQLDSKIKQNKIQLQYLKKQVNNKSTQIFESKQYVLNLDNDIKKLRNELNQFKIDVSQYTGQTNQCYIALQKLQEKISNGIVFSTSQIQQEKQYRKIKNKKYHEQKQYTPFQQKFTKFMIKNFWPIVLALLTTAMGFVANKYNQIKTKINPNLFNNHIVSVEQKK